MVLMSNRKKIKYLFSIHEPVTSRRTAEAYSVEASTVLPVSKEFSKEASFLAGVHGYTNKRRRDAYE